MRSYEFTLVVDRRLTDDEVDALFERCDDVSPERREGRTLLGFDRVAGDFAEALVSALHDVETTGPIVASVLSEDLVTLKVIAERTGRTYESVRLLATGRRGPGGFPAPSSSAGWSFYSWVQVRPWLDRHAVDVLVDPAPTDYDTLVAAADHLLRARALLRGDEHAASLAVIVAA